MTTKLQSIADTTLNWAGERGIEVFFQPETGSTNDNAKADALKRGDAMVIELTGHQTKGRGRGIHHWLDTGAGESLLSTWSFKAASAPQAITAPRVGLAVYNSVTQAWPSLAWSLKAPNDLFLSGKKCGGLLVETVSDGHHHRLLAGIGFNILNHPRKFVDATHLAQSLGRGPEEGEWFQFLDQLKEELDIAVLEAQKPELGEAVCKNLMQALNANSSAKITVTNVTPRGDLVHKGGTISWSEI